MVNAENEQKNWGADVDTYLRIACDLICPYVVGSMPAFPRSAEQKSFLSCL